MYVSACKPNLLRSISRILCFRTSANALVLTLLRLKCHVSACNHEQGLTLFSRL